MVGIKTCGKELEDMKGIGRHRRMKSTARDFRYGKDWDGMIRNVGFGKELEDVFDICNW